MINRELIRIKTVQLLYSYLLVENPFSLESQPSAPTKEKRFAYALYLDLLWLMTRIAEKTGTKNNKPLVTTQFIQKILGDDKIKSLRRSSAGGASAETRATGKEEYPFSSLADDLAVKVKESLPYRNYLKSLGEGAPDEKVWKDIFEHIIITDPALNEEISKRLNFTHRGVERMRGIMDDTFANFFASADNLPMALRQLNLSMEKAREFYFRLLALPLALTDLREREIDNARHKLLQRGEDINPSLRFIDNEYVKLLRENDDLQQGIKDYSINWIGESETTMRTLLKTIMQSEIYTEYMALPATDLKTDCDFWRSVYKNIIFLNESFLDEIETLSVFWNDDLDVLGSFILKTIKRISLSDGDPEVTKEIVLKMFKDEEDEKFGAELFSNVILHKDYYRSLILDNIDKTQWEMERMAFMDSVIIMTAVAEMLAFPKVPLVVTFNEYIEIAKYYSTPKSGSFINGFLGKIVKSLQDEGMLQKRMESKK